MSVDIYMYAEGRFNGVWKSCYPFECFREDGEISYAMKTVYENDWNYPLYSLLLRFDQEKCDGITSVIPPRGLPDDLSEELGQLISWRERTGWNCNHPSWQLLRELLEFPWERKLSVKSGFVNAEQYVIFRSKGQPEEFAAARVDGSRLKERGFSIADAVLSWFGKASLPDRSPNVISNEEMDQLVANGDLSSGAVTRIDSQISYADAEHCQVFLQHTVPLLKTFGEPDDVRIVFWN